MLAMDGRHWLRSQAESAQHVLPGFGPVSFGVGFAGKRVNTHGSANADMPNRSNARANNRHTAAIGGFAAVMAIKRRDCASAAGTAGFLSAHKNILPDGSVNAPVGIDNLGDAEIGR